MTEGTESLLPARSFEVCVVFSYPGEPPKVTVLASTESKKRADHMVHFAKVLVREAE